MEQLLKGASEAIEIAKSNRGRRKPKWLPPSKQDISDLRKAMKLSQAEFADLFGFEVSSVRNWEQGRTQPEGAARQIFWMIKSDPVSVLNLVKKAKENSFA